MVRIRIATFAVICIGAGVAMLWTGMVQTGWPRAQARILSVKTECQMEATERGILTKTTSRATIDCSDVEGFKALYDDKTWHVSERHTGRLAIVGPNAVRTELHLVEQNGHVPEAGETLAVVQNPDNPAEVKLAGSLGSSLQYGLIGIVIGLILVPLALPGLFRRRGAAPAPSPSRLDALFANPPTANPAPLTPAAPMSTGHMASAPSSGPVTDMSRQRASFASQQRPTFGRRNG